VARRTIDVVAAGPPSADLYDPAAPAWALAGALAARGHAVRAVFPGSAEHPPAPASVEVAPFPAVTAHVGTYQGEAELARAAGRQLRPDTQVVIRDPAGLGTLGHRAGRHALVSFVRSIAAEETGDKPASPPTGRHPFRFLGWGEGRGVRRLEREALSEATMIYCATERQREKLQRDYAIAAGRLRVGAPAVVRGPDAPTREAARRRVGVPDDILLVVALPPADPVAVGTAAPALEAFRRMRPIFPGARLAVLGATEAAAPGVIALPGRDAETIVSTVAAADVAVAVSSPSGLDPGLVLALRGGAATVVAPSVDLGDAAEGAVRRAATEDAGELASVLAELFADPEERRALGERGRSFAGRFAPERLAEELESAGALGAD